LVGWYERRRRLSGGRSGIGSGRGRGGGRGGGGGGGGRCGWFERLEEPLLANLLLLLEKKVEGVTLRLMPLKVEA